MPDIPLEPFRAPVEWKSLGTSDRQELLPRGVIILGAHGTNANVSFVPAVPSRSRFLFVLPVLGVCHGMNDGLLFLMDTKRIVRLSAGDQETNGFRYHQEEHCRSQIQDHL